MKLSIIKCYTYNLTDSTYIIIGNATNIIIISIQTVLNNNVMTMYLYNIIFVL